MKRVESDTPVFGRQYSLWPRLFLESANFSLQIQNFLVHTQRIEIEFARPHMTGFTLSSSADL